MTLLAEMEKIERNREEVTVSIHMEVTIGDDLDYSGWSSVGDGYGDRRPGVRRMSQNSWSTTRKPGSTTSFSHRWFAAKEPGTR